MSMIALIKRSVKQSIVALGDLVLAAKIAQEVESTPMPGEDYEADHTITSAKGVFEAVKYEDYPDTAIMIGDRTFLLLEFSVDVNLHDFVLVDGVSYHVFGVKPDMIAGERVLQKLLLRAEPKGIEWESDDPVAVTG